MFDFVIVNWNSGGHLRAALESICANHDSRVARVVVVDNASTDSSIDFLAAVDAPFPIQVLVNEENRGFGAACNQGALYGASDYLVFFNPDAQLLPDTLARLESEFERAGADRVGIIGPQNLNSDYSISRSCSRFPSLVSFLMDGLGLTKFDALKKYSQRMLEWDHLGSAYVDQVIGAFFAVRRPLFAALEGFDERFFVYFEEVDFSLRARKKGMLSYYLADAKIVHVGGGSSGQVKAKRLYYSISNRLRFVFKHFNWAQALLIVASTMTLELFARVVFCARTGGVRGVGEVLAGYSLVLGSFSRLAFEKRSMRRCVTNDWVMWKAAVFLCCMCRARLKRFAFMKRFGL